MSSRLDKENTNPYHPSFAAKAAKTAVKRSTTPTPNQIDKVVESVANATKRLSQNSNTSNSSKRKVENRIGPWRLGRTLGKGSTGRVRLAKHSSTGQLAAIKIVPKNIIDLDNNSNSNSNSTSEDSKKRKKRKHKVDENGLPYGIEREIIIMKLISHPNIMALYDVWENKNELYLVLEYVEGGELFEFLIKNGKLDEKNAVKYFRMIINGVSYCHKFNICHRDLKPENILLDKNGKIKIADFGMAALETQQKLLETSCGSPHYASPEIVAGKNYHGSPSDIWSCGVILFALLTGHLPFDDPNIRKLLLKVQSGKFHMPSNLSNDAKDLIWSMLRVDPNERIKIEDISNHPLMLKYPDNSINEVENKLDHLDISKPVKIIDSDILDNLQTLWHGIPKSHIIKMLQNNNKNSEKMFYYLLENYKLTHMNDIYANKPNLKKSISKTNVKSSNLQKSLPRSTSTIITTIQDESGNVLKSHIQELERPISQLKSKNIIIKSRPKSKSRSISDSNSRSSIVASTSFNKSISFKKLKRDATTSSISIVNMQRNLSIRPDSSINNLARLRRNKKSDEFTFDNSKNDYDYDYDNSNYINNSSNNKKYNNNTDISSSKSFTDNPKDLPELPDLQDFKYLVNSIFADDPSFNLKISGKKPEKTQNIINKDDIIVLDISDSYDDSHTTSNFTTSLDPRNSSANKSENNSTDHSNTTTTSIEITPPLSKLDQLKKELSIKKNQKNQILGSTKNRNFSGLKSIRSSSTRRLNSFLNDEYKNVSIDEFNTKQMSSNNKLKISTRSSNSLLDTNYSLHSFVEMKMNSPNNEVFIEKIDEGKIFEDADESIMNKNLISDSIIKNNIIIHKNVLSNIDSSDLRNSLITTSTNENLEPRNSRKLNVRNSNEIINNVNLNNDSETSKIDNIEEAANSDFDDADEFAKPNRPTTPDISDTSNITGSMYTACEQQPANKDLDPFNDNKTRVRSSMAPTKELFSANASNSLRIFTPPKSNKSVSNDSSPVDPFAYLEQNKTHPYTDLTKSNTSGTIITGVKSNRSNGVKNNSNYIPKTEIFTNRKPTQFSPTKENPTIKPSSNTKFYEKSHKHSNWFKKLFSSLNKHSSSNEGMNKTKLNTNSDVKPFSKFLSKFNKKSSTSTSNELNNKSFLPVSQHWLESDIITSESLITELKKDSNTKNLRVLSHNKIKNGCQYTVEVPDFKTTIQVEIIDKIGSEYGFGGCYIKFVKIKGTDYSFNHWCGIIRDIVASMEKNNDVVTTDIRNATKVK